MLQQGLDAQTDAVVLDSGGDGLNEMAAFLAGRHDLASIGVVAHGAAGAVALGTATLDGQSLNRYTREFAALGAALADGGELDLWSCEVAADSSGAAFVHSLAAETGASLAAADHLVGAPSLGGSWQLGFRTPGTVAAAPLQLSLWQ